MVANYHFSISADVSLPRYTLCKMVSKWRWWWWCALFPSIIWLLQSRIVSGPFRVSLNSEKRANIFDFSSLLLAALMQKSFSHYF